MKTIFLFSLIIYLTLSLTGTCKLSRDPKSTLSINGTVVFIQDSEDNITRISYAIQGLNPKSQHGIHVHEFGLIDGGCGNTGAHYNPHDKNHGSLNSWTRHIGDLGNLLSDDYGKSYGSVSTWNIGLFGKNSVIGRGLVVHLGVDDLGLGGVEASLANGNSGAREACCIIGITK